MNLNYTQKRRPRASFGTLDDTLDIPYLLKMQLNLYDRFLQADVEPNKREDYGLQLAFKKIFPIISNNGLVEMSFHGYNLEEPMFTVRECKERNLSYNAKVRVNLKLHIRSRDNPSEVREVREEPNVYMGEVPLMTDNGSFVINGTERVIVSQLHRAPGVYFMRDQVRQQGSLKINYQARMIPNNGSWLDFEFDSKGLLYFRIDKRRKMHASLLLRALGYSISDIISEFYDYEVFEINPLEELGDIDTGKTLEDQEVNVFTLNPILLRGMTLPFDIKKEGTKETVIKSRVRIKESDLRNLEREQITQVKVSDRFIVEGKGQKVSRRTYEDIIDPETGEVIVPVNVKITYEILDKLREHKITKLKTIYSNAYDCGPHISSTIRFQEAMLPIDTADKAREIIFRQLRPGDPTKPPEVVAKAFNDTFFNPERINLSKVGRMKINQRLGSHVEVKPTKMQDYKFEERPSMEYCVYVSRDQKKRVPKFDIMREIIPQDQLSNELLQLTLRDIKDEGPRVVAWHYDNPDKAQKLAKKIAETGLLAEVREQLVLSRDDIVKTIKTLINLVNRRGATDDIDSLGNRRVRMVGEFIQQEYESGLRRFQKAILDRMQQADSDNLKPSDLVNAKTIGQGVREFFNSNQLSQFMDQTNPLAEITHKRRVSALGVGGLQRDRAGFEVRDVHPTHYGRLCPIETPEGPNIGLINSLSLYSNSNDYGFITTPYRVVNNGKVSDDIDWLSAVEETKHYIAQANSEVKDNGTFVDEWVTCRRDGEFTSARPEDISYMDVAPSQIASVAAALIPFLEHDDSNRALMGSNMQRQAVSCLKPQKPLVGTGIEEKVASDSGHVVKAKRNGVIDFVDASRIVVRTDEAREDEFGVDIYNLTKYMRSNQNTTINQRPIVKTGDKVKAGDTIADSSSSDKGDLALGQNVLVAFMPWYGYNFEDSILVSEKMVIDDRFTSVHIEEHVCKARDTRNGPEQITRDIPNQPESALAYLDESGIIQIGTEVEPGDILVGKVTPKTIIQQTPEEKLLKAIFGNKGEDVKDTSMRMPSGSASTVIDVKVFTANSEERDQRALSIIAHELDSYKKDQDAKFNIYVDNANYERSKIIVGQKVAKAIKGSLKKDETVTKDWWKKATAEQRKEVSLKDEKAQKSLETIDARIKKMRRSLDDEYRKYEKKIKRNDELNPGVNKNIKVYLAIKRRLNVGDKMAGRHGNKGVVSRIVPVEDMPYLEDGTPVDLVLNPLGVPSRMNIGQILETHLGLASKALGDQIADMLEKEKKKAVKEIRAILPKIYARKKMKNKIDFNDFSDNEILEAAKNLKDGIPFATPIFDGATEEDINDMLTLSDLPTTGQMKLFDGRTGEPFERPVTVGYKYMFKLHHLVDEKMHSRSTGSYSLVTQQPLGGKAQGGGQRLGEMEVWALEAYGAAYTLWEMLTVKSDDRQGRNKIYESICKGNVELDPQVPESFKVLKSELRALCIDFEEE